MHGGKIGFSDYVSPPQRQHFFHLIKHIPKIKMAQTTNDLALTTNKLASDCWALADLLRGDFKQEVLPHVPDAWIDANKRDEKDQEIGIVGYEIPFNRHFYQYQPPRDLAEIDADLDAVSAEIMKLLQEVHS